jgi:uncharacterized protein
MRHLFLVLGATSLALGFIGIFLPVLPTTPFVLLAAYCFSKGSPKLHGWILASPLFGPMIADWENGGVIRLRAKITATALIVASFTWMTFFSRAPAIGKVLLDLMGVGVLGFIWSRPSAKVVPEQETKWPST